MSGRSIPRFALAGLLAAAFAAPAVAQNPLPEAPMPRAKAGAIEIALPFDGLNEKMLQTKTGSFLIGPSLEINVAPIPREVAQGPCCGADCCRKSAAAPPATAFGCTQLLRDDTYMLAKTMPQPVPPFVFAQPCQAPGLTTGGLGAWQPVPRALPPAALPPVFTVFGAGQLTATGQVIELTTVAANPLIGTWYRDTGVGVIAATFTHDELKLCLTQTEDGVTATFTVTAHYTLTKDGLVYGAITGADVDAKIGSKTRPEIGMELAELSLKLQELADCPFAFRAKMTSAGLMVSQLKAASLEGAGKQEYQLFGGVYKCAKDGIVPAPKETKAFGRDRGGRNDCQPVPLDIPVQTHPYPPAPTMSEPVQRVGVEFDLVPGRHVAPTSPPATPVCNDAMKSMAADAFAQMMRPTGGMTLPSGRYLDHYPQYFAPDPAFPLPRELACQEDPAGATRRGGTTPPQCQPVCAPAVQAGGYGVVTVTAQPFVCSAPAMPRHVGAWFRTIGSKRCVVKIEADHLTITVSEAHDFDGNTVTGHLTFTADYHITRDGLTAVGLITSVDAKFDGDLPEDEEQAMLEKVAEMQKALEEKPFAMTFRRYGETLVIGNVRMPEVGERGMDTPPGAYIGGRYASVGDKPLPKLKVVKASEPKPVPVYGPPLPPGLVPPQAQPGFYGYGAPPVYFPPSAPAPTGDLLPPQALPCPTAPRPVGAVLPSPRQRVIAEESWAPSAGASTQPTMPMPQPTPPTVLMPQPRPLALDLGIVVPPLSETPKSGLDNKQLFNFWIGIFGNQ